MDLIHVGMPKAASTWLQEVFFPAHPELAVLGARQGDDDLYGAFLQQVRTLVHGGDLCTDAAAATDEMQRLARELGRRRGARLLGISHEALCGEWPAGRNAAFLADALAKAFPEAKVLLVLREPRSLLLSSYRQYVRMGGTAPLAGFLWDPAHCGGFATSTEPLRSHVVEFCRHAPRVRLYRERFPAGMRVECLERLQRDPAAFAADLRAFLGVSEAELPERRTNVQLSDPALRLLRRLNHLADTRMHRRHGPRPLAALAAARLRRRLPAEHPWRGNRSLLARLAAEQLHRAFVDGPLSCLDGWLLRRLPAGRAFSLQVLPPERRTFLEDLFAADGDELRGLLTWDPADYGYLCSASGRGSASGADGAAPSGVAASSSRSS